MTALSTRDALAKAIWEASRADEGTISYLGANIVAQELLASGAVVDAATLADDEAAIGRVMWALAPYLSYHDDDFPREAARAALRAIPTERGDT